MPLHPVIPDTTLTDNYEFYKITHGTNLETWDVPWNADMDFIDTEIKNRADEAADALDAAAAAQTTANHALPKTGGTMTGHITLVGPPVDPLNPATKDYADALVTGPLANKSDKGLVDGLTSYTATGSFALTDLGAVVQINNSAADAVMTIPLQATVVWPDRARFDIVRMNVKEVSLVIPAGGTIFSAGNKKRLNVQYSGATLVRLSADNWLLIGDIKT